VLQGQFPNVHVTIGQYLRGGCKAIVRIQLVSFRPMERLRQTGAAAAIFYAGP